MTCSYIATLPAGVIADGSVNGWLTVIAGFAALDALRGALAECGVASEDCGLRLKWPNDLFCQGRKLGGILTAYRAVAEFPTERFRGRPACRRRAAARGDLLRVLDAGTSC